MRTIPLVREFHKAFSHPINETPTLPAPLPDGSFFRVNLLQEELNELQDALEEGDMVEVLDALTDLAYVLAGTYLEFGLASVSNEAFLEVHRSNMSKLGADGKPIKREDGKTLKGPNYFRPNLSSILEKAK